MTEQQTNTIERIAQITLIAIAGLNVLRGVLHAFLPDSGAGTIANIDISTNAQNIIFLIAVIGERQLVIAAFQLLVALHAKQYLLFAFIVDAGMMILPRLTPKEPASEFPGLIAHNIEFAVVLVVIALLLYSKRKSSK